MAECTHPHLVEVRERPVRGALVVPYVDEVKLEVRLVHEPGNDRH